MIPREIVLSVVENDRELSFFFERPSDREGLLYGKGSFGNFNSV